MNKTQELKKEIKIKTILLYLMIILSLIISLEGMKLEIKYKELEENVRVEEITSE